VSSSSIAPLLYPLPVAPRPWIMSHAERCAVLQILRISKPVVSLEIGTAGGGCLQHIRAHSQHTFSIDINPDVAARLSAEMPDVEFLTGNSPNLIHEVFRRCAARHQPLEFILVDGDHSRSGVLADLTAILAHIPCSPLWIAMHDTANPECRRGIEAAPWSAHPHVHMVDLDFVPGALSEGETFRNQLWGGLGVALLRPDARTAPLPAIPVPNLTHSALFRASLDYPSVANRIRRWWRVKRRGLHRRFPQIGRFR
jgi:hypothetical protein